MKKAMKFLSFATIVAILFTACNKSDPAPTTLQRLQAKWNFQKEYYHDVYSGVESRDTTYANPGDYSDFRTDGKIYSKYGTSYDTTSYSLLGDNKIVTTYSYGGFSYNDTASILVLNDNQFQVYSKTFDPAPDYYEYTDFFTK